MAEKTILVDINLNGNYVKEAKVEVLSSAPSNPGQGRIYANSTDGKLYYYNGANWVGLIEYNIISASSVDGSIPIYDSKDGDNFILRVLKGSGIIDLSSEDGIITISSVPDNIMSSSSENTVQNKIIKAYIDDLVTLTALTSEEVDSIFE